MTRFLRGCVAALCALSVPSKAAEWKPEKAVEIVVNTSPGNGPDRTARVIQGILQDRKQIDVPVAVNNKIGGGGVLAYTYLNTRPGDGHMLMIASKALLTNHLAGRGPSYTEFTPIAHLFGEYMVVTVKPDSPIGSGKDLVARVKQNPAGVSFGIATSLGNPIHQSVAVPLRAEGIDIKSLKNVVFNAGSASLAAMMGGHVDVVPVTAALAVQLAAARQVRLLAVTSAQRLPGALADVPTWRELGYDAVVSQWRGVVGPKGMSDAQVAYWERMLKRMSEDTAWKLDIAKNFWSAEFMDARTMRQFMDRDHAALKVFLGELGLAK
jgi:putative tricarboxylic transport membrane protein